MLSTQAWNAFLKTLEEPPPHTIFVLATTEADQGAADGRRPLPPLRLRAPDAAQIAGVLRRVAEPSRSRSPTRRAALIARSATGSFRDALGTLEQLRRLLGQRRSRSRTCSRCSAPPTPTCCSARSTRSPPATRARRCWPPPGWPSRAATSAASSATSRRTCAALMVVQTLGRGARRARASRRAGRAAGRAGAPRRPGRRRAAARPDRRRAARDEGRRRPAHPARARARQGAPQPEHDPSRQALLARLERLEARGLARAGPRAGSAPRRPPRPRPRREQPGAGRTAVAVTAQVEGSRRRRRDHAARRRRRPGRGAARADEAAAAVAAELATEADRRPRSPPSPSWSPTAPAPSRASPSASSSTCDGVAELWPAVLDSLAERARRCWPRVLENARPPALDGGELTLSWAESAALLQAQGRGPGLPRARSPTAIRAVTGSSLRLAYALARRRRARPPAPAAPALSEEELVDRFMRGVRRRGAARRGGVPDAPAAQPQQHAPAGPEDAGQSMMAAQEKLKDERVEASAGGGMVKVVISGDSSSRRSRSTPTPSTPRTSRCSRTWSSPRSTRRCARPRSSSRRRGRRGDAGGMDPIARARRARRPRRARRRRRRPAGGRPAPAAATAPARRQQR